MRTRGEEIMAQEIKSAPVGLRLTPSFKAELEALAKADSRPLASYIELILKQHIAAKKVEGKSPKRK
jgi:predicted DNA-binding protein